MFATLAIPSAALAQVTAVRFSRLWDGTRVVQDAVVTIEGGRIVNVSSGDAAVPKGAFAAIPGRRVYLPIETPDEKPTAAAAKCSRKRRHV